MRDVALHTCDASRSKDGEIPCLFVVESSLPATYGNLHQVLPSQFLYQFLDLNMGVGHLAGYLLIRSIGRTFFNHHQVLFAMLHAIQPSYKNLLFE
jgi:hypothetical protein